MAQKSILITGCSSGIGYDAAHTLKKRGWQVFATCRQQKDCDRLIAEGLESFRLDYADEDNMTEAVEEVFRRTGGTLDALFNNGAYAIPAAVEDLPRAALREIYEVNLFGQFDLIRRVLPAMKKAGKGRIVNNSSVLGFVALKFRGAYVSTKFAMEGMTDALRLEHLDTGIHVILIQPGPVTSSIRQNSIPHFERWIDYKNSAQRETYEAKLVPRLYDGTGMPDKWELPASAVSKKLIHALEARRPHARYMITTPTYIMNAFRRLLPTRWLDKVLAGS